MFCYDVSIQLLAKFSPVFLTNFYELVVTYWQMSDPLKLSWSSEKRPTPSMAETSLLSCKMLKVTFFPNPIPCCSRASRLVVATFVALNCGTPRSCFWAPEGTSLFCGVRAIANIAAVSSLAWRLQKNLFPTPVNDNRESLVLQPSFWHLKQLWWIWSS